MPTHLDHDARRAELAQAVWRIVLREGVTGASVRGVAREAGLATGSVRYVFSTQAELLQFAMREVIDVAGRRIRAGADKRAALVERGRPLDAALELLEQVLPFDHERLVEARVWAAFTAQTITDPELAAIRREADDAVRQLCRDCLGDLRKLGLVDRARDVTLETERLWALLDGLTMHVLLDPRRGRVNTAARIVRAHLQDLSPR